MLVFVNLSDRVVVREGPVTWGHVGDDVRVVGHTPLVGPRLVRELSVFLVAHAGHSEVDHVVNVDASSDQSHAGQLGNRCAQAVAGDADLRGGVNALEALHLSNDFVLDRVGRVLETAMNGAVTLRPCLILISKELGVSKSALNVISALKNNIN